MEVYVYLIEHHILNSRRLLYQLGFGVGGTHAFSRAESMQGIMVLNLRRQVSVQDTCHHLPEDLHHYNYVEIPVSLWYQYSGLPGALFFEVTLPEVGLDKSDDLLPVVGVKCVFPRYYVQPIP